MTPRTWYLQEAVGSRRREIVTPEGVPLTLVLATAGSRLCAFLVDLAIAGALSLVVFLVGSTQSWLGAFTIFTTFLITNFYFAWFEFRWQGTTPGKRLVKIRVCDARGGVLTGEAVVARNLTRNFEMLLPLQGILLQRWAWPDAPVWAWAVGSLWLVGFGLLPLFNADRRRVGDLVAGTMVVDVPRVVLLEDLGARRRAEPMGAPEFAFTPEQLDIYGVHELQVLEDLLRRAYDVEESILDDVYEHIRRKIGWNPERGGVNSLRFLQAFYKAQRARLEQRLLFGEYRERKRGS